MKNYLAGLFFLFLGITISSILNLYISTTITLTVSALFLPAFAFLWWLLKQKHLQKVQLQDISQRVEQAVNKERERIYRNLHDDIGAQLLNLVFKAPDPEAADIARVALQNMREVIAKTVDKQLSLPELLGDIRVEIENRLSNTAIKLNWNIPHDLLEKPLQASQIISISRIFREGLSNTLKHSNATEVTFEARSSDDELTLSLSDNGIGKLSPGKGRGLASMQQRAKKIKAQLEVTNLQPHGIMVKIIL